MVRNNTIKHLKKAFQIKKETSHDTDNQSFIPLPTCAYYKPEKEVEVNF